MSIGMFALGGIAVTLTIGWYIRHSQKRSEANLDRLKEEVDAAILKEKERLAQTKATDRQKPNLPRS